MTDDLTRNTTSWKDITVEGSLENFATTNNLDTGALNLSSDEVMLLPCNTILPEASKEQHLFANTTKELLVALKEGGIKTRLYHDTKENGELVLKSADIIAPVLIFLDSPAGSLAMNILANWIYDNWVKLADKFKPSLRVEYAEIKQPGVIKRWRRIEGNADDVYRLVLEESKLLANESLPKLPGPSAAQVPEQPVNTKSVSEPRQTSARVAMEVVRDLIKEAQAAIRNNETQVAEKFYRRGLAKIREAVLWEPYNESHIKYLHKVGRFVHDTFGCTLEFDEDRYWISCPVALSHTKGGFSMGGAAKAVCSICWRDSLDCEHVPGRVYNNVIASRQSGSCNICLQEECGHEEGKTYDGVEALVWIKEMQIDHIAIVEHPAQPLATFMKISVSESEMRNGLPEEEREVFKYGQIVHCHHCLICNGA